MKNREANFSPMKGRLRRRSLRIFFFFFWNIPLPSYFWIFLLCLSVYMQMVSRMNSGHIVNESLNHVINIKKSEVLWLERCSLCLPKDKGRASISSSWCCLENKKKKNYVCAWVRGIMSKKGPFWGGGEKGLDRQTDWTNAKQREHKRVINLVSVFFF